MLSNDFLRKNISRPILQKSMIIHLLFYKCKRAVAIIMVIRAIYSWIESAYIAINSIFTFLGYLRIINDH